MNKEEIKVVLEEILGTLRKLDERMLRIEGLSQVAENFAAVQSVKKKMSLKEFIIEKSPENAVQMTLVIGYYIEYYDGVSPFNASDLEKGFRAAKEPIPTNINDKANMSVAKGHLMEEKEKKNSLKAWVLTRSGEDLVQNGFKKK